MQFDKIEVNDGIEYGMMLCDSRLVYIKVGNGGSIFGYNNKYLEIATDVVRKYGCSVLVASNPLEVREKENIDRDMSFINYSFPLYVKSIFGLGVSNGGVMFLQNAYRYPEICSVLTINAPLMINWLRTRRGIEKVEQTVHCMYGTKDPSYRYIELLQLVENVQIIAVEGADHNFTQHYKEFRNAVDLFFDSNGKNT